MKIFLIGSPGSGKSTMAKEVSDKMGRAFVDLDAEIVKGEGQSIAGIFEEKGETKFREIEKKYLMRWCNQPIEFIMATGGGTPCFLSNMEVIKKSGLSIFLDTDVSVIAQRMMNTELAKRPLFAGQNELTIAERVAQMRSERISFYNLADIKLSGLQISVDQIISEILKSEGKA